MRCPISTAATFDERGRECRRGDKTVVTYPYLKQINALIQSI